MASLANPKGINSTSVIDVPDVWNAEWFRRFIRTQLSQADVRNAKAGTGVTITGNPTTSATISIASDVQALFHQPYILEAAPSGISGAFDTYRVLAPQAGVLTITDGGAQRSITVGVAANGIGNPQLRQGAALSVIGNTTNAAANVADITASADNTALVRLGGTLSFAPVPLAALATQANNTVVGSISGSAAAPTALSKTQLTALVNAFSGSLSGAVPASGGGTTNFLRADGSFAAPAYPVGANPTANVGPTAVNGSAATFLRSDAAPAIDLTAIYPWTGLHKFIGSGAEKIRLQAITAGASTFQSWFDSDGVTRRGFFGFSSSGTSTVQWANEVSSGNIQITPGAGAGVQLDGKNGFQGTAPIAKPAVTGSRGGNVALASFLTALANYGLITDSTTV